jgi:hypothetical protein
MVGSMLYLAISTRPDISYAVGELARFMAAPTSVHWQAAKGLLRYLAGTAAFGLVFGGGEGLVGYTDADYAGCPDTRRSTGGYLFMMGGAAISWSAKRQPTVSLSTVEAEYVAASQAVREAVWLKLLEEELDVHGGAVNIYADNQGAIKLLKNPVISARSKHIEVAYHFARERVQRGDVEFKFVRSEEMLADVLTKALPKPKHLYCVQGIGLS